MNSEITVSSKESRNERQAQAIRPGVARGSVTRLTTRQGGAPSVAAAASISSGRLASAVVIIRMTKGTVTVIWPSTRPGSVAASFSGEKNSSSARPVIRVGRSSGARKKLVRAPFPRNRPFASASAAGSSAMSSTPTPCADPPGPRAGRMLRGARVTAPGCASRLLSTGSDSVDTGNQCACGSPASTTRSNTSRTAMLDVGSTQRAPASWPRRTRRARASAWPGATMNTAASASSGRKASCSDSGAGWRQNTASSAPPSSSASRRAPSPSCTSTCTRG